MEECFIIMPISAPSGYAESHFHEVYEHLIKPSCEQAGLQAVRGDDVSETNLIHLDILNRLLESPMAICDLSAHNPNVLFELGLRQAFDKPVVLIQEVGTPRIFDIAPIRILEYHPALKYSEVPNDQRALASALKETRTASDKGTSVNSITRLLSLTAAHLAVPESGEEAMISLLRSEIADFRDEFRRKTRSERTLDSTLLDDELQTVLSAKALQNISKWLKMHRQGIITTDEAEPRIVNNQYAAELFLGKAPEIEEAVEQAIAELSPSSPNAGSSEQDGADQPSTAEESKSKGSDKPKSESEGRSQ